MFKLIQTRSNVSKLYQVCLKHVDKSSNLFQSIGISFDLAIACSNMF